MQKWTLASDVLKALNFQNPDKLGNAESFKIFQKKNNNLFNLIVQFQRIFILEPQAQNLCVIGQLLAEF